METRRCSTPGYVDAAQYAVAMAYRIRFVMQMTAREAMHLTELRSQPQGHPVVPAGRAGDASPDRRAVHPAIGGRVHAHELRRRRPRAPRGRAPDGAEAQGAANRRQLMDDGRGGRTGRRRARRARGGRAGGDDRTRSRCAGSRTFGPVRPLTADSIFYVGSIAKQFVAACVAMLERDGDARPGRSRRAVRARPARLGRPRHGPPPRPSHRRREGAHRHGRRRSDRRACRRGGTRELLEALRAVPAARLRAGYRIRLLEPRVPAARGGGRGGERHLARRRSRSERIFEPLGMTRHVRSARRRPRCPPGRPAGTSRPTTAPSTSSRGASTRSARVGCGPPRPTSPPGARTSAGTV